jgi:hypothetical protein
VTAAELLGETLRGYGTSEPATHNQDFRHHLLFLLSQPRLFFHLRNGSLATNYFD